MISKDAV